MLFYLKKLQVIVVFIYYGAGQRIRFNDLFLASKHIAIAQLLVGHLHHPKFSYICLWLPFPRLSSRLSILSPLNCLSGCFVQIELSKISFVSTSSHQDYSFWFIHIVNYILKYWMIWFLELVIKNLKCIDHLIDIWDVCDV